jgi:two-component system CheB/CheR fusion protein
MKSRRLLKEGNRGNRRVVGIGASAGGLAAVKLMLQHLAPKTGLSFVLVQHLSASHPSVLVDLLSPIAKLRVSGAEDGTPLTPDRFYVCPPGFNINLENGVIRLIPLADAQKGHMSIDDFFCSLARDQQKKAVGVILSGAASDGAGGLRAIKHAGGVTFAEDPAAAEHAGMPRSAIETGCVDYVMSVPEIAGALSRIATIPLDGDPEHEVSDTAEAGREGTETILHLLKSSIDIDFSHYRPATVARRISRRMAVHGLEAGSSYAEYLTEHPAELEMLANDLLIGVTEFFRDASAFEALATHVYPALAADPDTNRVRVWVAGCSSGQEAYSIAISLLEFFGERPSPDFQIFATDLSAKAIVKARLGIYSPEEARRGLSEERIKRFFNPVEHGYQIQKRLREMCVFAEQNVIKDPPFSRLDLICCRNLLIYLKPAAQERLLSLFHFALKPDRYMLLGKSESISGDRSLFMPVDKANRIFVRTEHKSICKVNDVSDAAPRPAPAPQPEPQLNETRADLQTEADRVLLDRYSPGAVVVDQKMRVALYRGCTGRYLEAAPGKPDLNLLSMVRPGTLTELEPAFERAKEEQLPVRVESLRVERDPDSFEINLEIIPLGPPIQAASHFLVVFEEASAHGRRTSSPYPKISGAKGKDRENARLRRELLHSQSYLRSVIQKHTARDEELTALNEEILSNNEEFQSMNEELEAAKEELQASQEELTTLNEELRVRNAELSRVNDNLSSAVQRAEDAGAYARAVVETVREPLMLLDGELRIQEANAAFYAMFGFESKATVGTRIDELGGDWWHDPDFLSILKQALADGAPSPECEREVSLGEAGVKSLVFSARPIDVSRRPGPLILLAIADVTSQKRALEAAGLRSLSAHLQKQLEMERTRIARQVHDEIGQSLTALQFELSGLKGDRDAFAPKPDRMIEMVKGTIQKARDIAGDLRPPLLDEFGLKAATEWQLEAFEARTGIKTNLDYRVTTLPPNPDLLTDLVRILQEAITNIARHAQASVATVTLTDGEGELVMEISDNGVGIDLAKTADPRALGILGMKERCSAHHGRLLITKGEGTTVRVEVPTVRGRP